MYSHPVATQQHAEDSRHSYFPFFKERGHMMDLAARQNWNQGDITIYLPCDFGKLVQLLKALVFSSLKCD